MSADITNAEQQLLALYDRVADSPDAIPRLRRLVLDLAVRGKLVEQDPDDEPASELLERIAAKKARLLEAGKIRKKAAQEPKMVAPPYELPTSWSWAPLGSIAYYDAGTKCESRSLDQSLWLLELEDVEKETGQLLNRFTVADRVPKSTKSEFQTGDILYGKLRPYLTKVLVADKPGYSTTEIVSIRPFIDVCPEYFALGLRRPDFVDYVTRLGQGTKMPRLRTEDAVVSPFPLPPISEQHRIVAKVEELMALLDRLEATRTVAESTRDRLTAASLSRLTAPNTTPGTFPAHARFALDSLSTITTRGDQIQSLRQTILDLAVRGKLVEQNLTDESVDEQLQAIRSQREAMVQSKELRRERPIRPVADDEPPFAIPDNWKWVRVGDLALFTQYGTSKKAAKSNSGVPVLTMGNIQKGLIIRRNEKRLPGTSAELPSLYLKKFDLLYNRTNSAELVGKTGLYLGEDDCLTFASYLIRIRLQTDHTSPIYVNLVMNAPSFRGTQIIPHIKKQTGQANVNGSALKNMLVPLPPLAEQHRIVANVDELMALCDRLEVAVTTVDSMKQRLLEVLLHRALAGDIQSREAA